MKQDTWTRTTGKSQLGCIACLVLGMLAANAATRNVVSYGAVPNDGLNDYTAFAAAIAAAGAGDEVYIPDGVYNIGTQLNLKPNLTFRGQSPGGAILKPIGTSITTMVYAYAATNVTVCDFTIDGQTNTVFASGVLLNKSSSCYVHHVTVKNILTTGLGALQLCATSNSIVAFNTISNISVNDDNGAGILINNNGALGSPSNQITGNKVMDVGSRGLSYGGGSDGGVIQYNEFVNIGSAVPGSAGFAIEVQDRAYHHLAEYNWAGHGLSMVSWGLWAARGNLVMDDAVTKGWGVECGGRTSITTRNKILSGTKSAFGASGLGFDGLIADNLALKCTYSSISLGGDGSFGSIDAYVYNNIISNCPAPQGGFEISGSLCGATLEKNVICNNGATGIWGFSGGADKMSFINNTIVNNVGDSVSPVTMNNLEWTGNIVTGNGYNRNLSNSGGWQNNLPVPGFTCLSNVAVGQVVNFTNTSTTPNPPFVKWLWDFDAGLPNTNQNPSYVYAEPGTYRVKLVVRDNSGRSRLAEHAVTVAPQATDLLILPLDEPTGIPVDTSLYGHTVTRNGTLTSVNSLIDRALNFTNGYLTVSGVNASSGNFGLSAWLRLAAPPASSGAGYCALFSETNALAGFGTGITTNGAVRFWTAGLGGNIDVSTAANLVAAQRWHKIQFDFTNGTANIYIDGILRAAQSGTLVPTTGGSFNIGRFGGAQTPSGILDAIKVSRLGAVGFTTLPVAATVVRGYSATLSAVAVSAHPVSYQWLKGGVPILSATNATYTITNAQPGSAGAYSVIASNDLGSVTSLVVSLTVVLPPIIQVFTQKNGQCIFTWNTASNFTYQLQSATNLLAPGWTDVGAPITATNSAVSTADTIAPDEPRFYRVRFLQ